jgi:hypothetical protein
MDEDEIEDFNAGFRLAVGKMGYAMDSEDVPRLLKWYKKGWDECKALRQ